jgi:hypothetical protein
VANGTIEITSPAEVRVILGKGGKPMPEATFKTRLALLEAECPEFQRQPYRRTFSQFHCPRKLKRRNPYQTQHPPKITINY